MFEWMMHISRRPACCIGLLGCFGLSVFSDLWCICFDCEHEADQAVRNPYGLEWMKRLVAKMQLSLYTHSCLWCSWCRFHLKPHAGLSAIFSPCSRLHLGVCSGYLCSLLCLPKISPLPLSSQHLLMSGDLILFTFPIFPFLPFLSSPLYLVLCPSPPLLPFSQVFNPSIQSRVLWCN